MPIKAKFFQVCSTMFWRLGLVIPSLKTYIAAVREIRNTKPEVISSPVVYSYDCESGCCGIEVCTEAPARSLHDYEGLRHRAYLGNKCLLTSKYYDN